MHNTLLDDLAVLVGCERHAERAGRYAPELQPTERLWRQWRPNVTHNHTRGEMEPLIGDSDGWLERLTADPRAVLSAVGQDVGCSMLNMAA